MRLFQIPLDLAGQMRRLFLANRHKTTKNCGMTRKTKKESLQNPPHVDDGLEDSLTKRHAFGIATMLMITMFTFHDRHWGLSGIAIMKYRYISDGPLKSRASV